MKFRGSLKSLLSVIKGMNLNHLQTIAYYLENKLFNFFRDQMKKIISNNTSLEVLIAHLRTEQHVLTVQISLISFKCKSAGLSFYLSLWVKKLEQI